MVQQAPRCRDENIDAGSHRVLLRRHPHSAVDSRGGDRRVHSHRIERRKNLRGELTRRCDYKHASLSARLAYELMQNREDKRGGLAAASHRTRKDVASFECGGYGFGLDRGWSLEAELFEAFVETRVKL